jgi:serine protease Do
MLFITGIATAGDDKGKEIPRSSQRPGWLGVGIQDVTPRFARGHNLTVKEGAYVNEVADDSPADSAGLNEGDIILEFNGKRIETADDLTEAVRGTAPGTKVSIKVNRNGESKSLSATIRKGAKRSSFAIGAPRGTRVMMNMFNTETEGMELMELNKQLGEYFEAPGGSGVLVTRVEQKEPAAEAGIKAGDVLVKVGNDAVKDAGDVREALADKEEGTKVPVELLRKGKKMTVTLVVSDEEEDGDVWHWKHPIPGNFNFHFEPQMDRLHDEIESRLREIPKHRKELQRIESTRKSKEI